MKTNTNQTGQADEEGNASTHNQNSSGGKKNQKHI